MGWYSGLRARRAAGRYAVVATATIVGLGMGAAVVAGAAPAATATATTLYVSLGGLDSGTCTSSAPCADVTYALTKAVSGSTIEVSGTIDDHVSVSIPVTITDWVNGPAGSPGVLDGAASGTVVSVSATGVVLKDLTVQHGALGIFNSGTLTVTDSTVSANATTAEGYAGIYNYGGAVLTVTDSTIAANVGGGTIGAGLFNQGTTTVVASTVAGNTGGGIYAGQLAVATVGASIVANNANTRAGTQTGLNCYGYDAASLVSIGDNLTNDATGTACAFTAATDLVGKKPALGALAGNGGPTQTMLVPTTSPAAGAIPSGTTLRGVAVCPGTDQRGVARPGTGETRCTIGAVEAGATRATVSTVSVTPASVAAAGTRVAYLIVVRPKSGAGTPTGTVSFKVGSTSLCTAVLSGGVAACGATNAPVGTDTVTGTYSGGGGFATSSGAATLKVA